MSSTVKLSIPDISFVNPLNSCERITPELPLAPLKEPDEIAFASAFISGFSNALTYLAADMIVMDYKPFTPFSDENIDGHILFGMTGKLCRTTIANGKILMKDRELIGIDEEAENAHILEASKKLWGALNDCTY